MLIIVTVDFGVAFKAHWDTVLISAWPLLAHWNNVINFHFHAAKAVTDTTAAMARNQELCNILLRKIVAHIA
jgi:hypothetical protein